MTPLRLVAKTPAETAGTVLVVPGHWREKRLMISPLAGFSSSLTHRLASAAATVADAGSKEPIRLPSDPDVKATSTVIAVVNKDSSDESLRQALGTALRNISADADVVVGAAGANPAQLRALAEGAGLGAYRYTRYHNDAAKRPKRITLAIGHKIDKTSRSAVSDAGKLVSAVSLARDLVNDAPNDLVPETMAQVCRDTFENSQVSVKVWSDAQLRRGKFGGLTAVGQGSAHPPRLVRLQYRPAKSDRHVALVGKGITFDSGGLSLKPAKAMEWMKADMGGAAAVLGAVKLAADWKLPIAVTGWLALAENMPSGTAQRPGDVITIRGGKTVEVLNTDAEGRLVLADALIEAAKEDPDEIIDVATLTGAQLVALGPHVAGAMGNDDALRADVVAAGATAGESLWPMPLPPELRPSLDSPMADIANIGDRNGGMLTAGLFLAEFVPDEIPWVHLDIAGPAFNDSKAYGYVQRGGTGFAVRTLAQHLRDSH